MTVFVYTFDTMEVIVDYLLGYDEYNMYEDKYGYLKHMRRVDK